MKGMKQTPETVTSPQTNAMTLSASIRSFCQQANSRMRKLTGAFLFSSCPRLSFSRELSGKQPWMLTAKCGEKIMLSPKQETEKDSTVKPRVKYDKARNLVDSANSTPLTQRNGSVHRLHPWVVGRVTALADTEFHTLSAPFLSGRYVPKWLTKYQNFPLIGSDSRR